MPSRACILKISPDMAGPAESVAMPTYMYLGIHHSRMDQEHMAPKIS